jgi:hypothetical protein
MASLERRISRRRHHSKPFATTWRDVVAMLDAIFIPNRLHMPPGWIMMEANRKGRELIDALFPSGIAWRADPDFQKNMNAPDWLGFELNVPVVVHELEALGLHTNLPFEIMPPGHTIDDCNPDQWALLLAFGVRRGGGRAAQLTGDVRDGTARFEIYRPNEAH